MRWLIQVKRRERPEKTEEFETLQRILGTLVFEDSRYGIIVSTADKFSYWANLAANDAKTSGYTIELIDKGKLDRMIQPLIPHPPWEDIFSRPEFEFISDDVKLRFHANHGGQLTLDL